MSQLETNPLIADTIEIRRQNQQLEETKPEIMIKQVPDNYTRVSVPFDTQQIDIPGIASMFKYHNNFLWSTGDLPGTDLYTFELKLLDILPYAPLATGNQVFVNFDSITFLIENTFNPFYQGSLLVYYDPAPSVNYYATAYGRPQTQNMAWQYKQRDIIQTKNRSPFMMTVDVKIPFNFFQIMNSYPAAENYIKNYSFGRFSIMVNTRLQTKAAKQTLSLRTNLCINNYSTAGSKFI